MQQTPSALQLLQALHAVLLQRPPLVLSPSHASERRASYITSHDAFRFITDHIDYRVAIILRLSSFVEEPSCQPVFATTLNQLNLSGKTDTLQPTIV